MRRVALVFCTHRRIRVFKSDWLRGDGVHVHQCVNVCARYGYTPVDIDEVELATVVLLRACAVVVADKAVILDDATAVDEVARVAGSAQCVWV